MQNTPAALRRHVVIIGKTNTGKSTIFNALTQQQTSIVSPQAGTTTDPVSKAMELIPFGPIVLVDTAGLEDNTTLGEARMKKTKEAARRADFILYVANIHDFDSPAYTAFCRKNIPHILILNGMQAIEPNLLSQYQEEYPSAFFYTNEKSNIEELRLKLATSLSQLTSERETFIGDLLPAGSTVVMVMPIDSAAPKGRIILPQVQLLRDCLDHHFTAVCCQTEELSKTLENLPSIDLVITDSQAFAKVNRIVPRKIPLTSFSILMARKKGSLSALIEGTNTIEKLKPGDKILMLEGCTHNQTHEDIGRVKIPALLQKKTGAKLNFDFFSGYQFPENLADYAFAIQCGSCMLNESEVKNRMKKMKQAALPVTNYGMCLAILSGAWNRCKLFLEGATDENSADDSR